MKNTNDDDQPLSLDPEENLRMENQLLELKLKAQFGAKTFMGNDVPADIENEFLKNVLQFENSFSKSEEKKIRDLLGDRCIIPDSELNDLETEQSLVRVMEMLLEINIVVNFIGTYDSRTQYKFITEELFEERVFLSGIPDMMMHFIYEEFHPNHKIDLENRTRKFITAWLEREPDKLAWELADGIVIPEGLTLDKELVKQKIVNSFNCFTGFSDCEYQITNISFKITTNAGMGCSEGEVSFTAAISGGGVMRIQGPFSLYFYLEYGWWDICYFRFPGFEFT